MGRGPSNTILTCRQCGTVQKVAEGGEIDDCEKCGSSRHYTLGTLPEPAPKQATVLTCRTCGTAHTLAADGVVRNCPGCGGRYYRHGMAPHAPEPIRFHVAGRPEQKARPRAFQDKGGNIRMYSPEKTRRYESLIRDAYFQAVDKSQKAVCYGPIQLDIYAYFAVPKSKPKWFHKLLDGPSSVFVTTAPDLDNIAKGVCDALNGVAWHDDRQVCTLFVMKSYSTEPRLTVEIAYLPEPQKPQKEA